MPVVLAFNYQAIELKLATGHSSLGKCSHQLWFSKFFFVFKLGARTWQTSKDNGHSRTGKIRNAA